MLLGRYVLASLKLLAGTAFAGSVFWFVVSSLGGNGIMYIHINEAPFEVFIDGEEFRVASYSETPIVVESRPGTHEIRWRKNGEQRFSRRVDLSPGQELVVTVLDEVEYAEQLKSIESSKESARIPLGEETLPDSGRMSADDEVIRRSFPNSIGK